jgi:hypothetical protein
LARGFTIGAAAAHDTPITISTGKRTAFIAALRTKLPGKGSYSLYASRADFMRAILEILRKFPRPRRVAEPPGHNKSLHPTGVAGVLYSKLGHRDSIGKRLTLPLYALGIYRYPS